MIRRTIALSLFVCALASAQTTTTTSVPAGAPVVDVPSLSDVVHTIIGTPIPADSPVQLVGIGSGYKHGMASGKISGAIAITPGTYMAAMTSFQAGNQSYKAGVKQYLLGTKSGSFGFLVNVDGGVATGATTGAAFGTGGDFVFRIGSSKYIDVGAEFDKADIQVLTSSPLSKASFKHLASTAEITVWLLGKLK